MIGWERGKNMNRPVNSLLLLAFLLTTGATSCSNKRDDHFNSGKARADG
jgi:hypothetical protein